DDFEERAAERAGYHDGTYHLGTSIEWTADGGRHDYVATVFDLRNPNGTQELVWMTDIPTGCPTAEGYGSNVMYPVTPTNLLEASDLVLSQLNNVPFSGRPDGPLSTLLIATHASSITDPLPALWPSVTPTILPSLVPEPSALSLVVIGGLLTLVCRRR